MKSVIKSIRPILFTVLPTIFFLLIFSKWPFLTEKVYSEFAYVGITRVMTWLFGWIPFSLSEIIILLLLPALLLLFLLTLFRKIRFLQTLYILVYTVCILFTWFYFSWGFNYLRQPLISRLNLSPSVADTSLVKQALEIELKSANDFYMVYQDFDKDKIDREIERCYRQVEKQLGISLPGGIRKPKPMLIHAILNRTMTSGIFSPFFHEVHVNMELLPIQYPLVLAHEKAHQMGIASEAEANFLAYLVCMSSDMPELRYSAHYSQVSKLLRRAYTSISDYGFYRKQVRLEINADFKRVREHWLKYAGAVADFSHKAYDQYLKANRIKEGVKNYAGDIDMLIWWKVKNGELVRGDSGVP